MDKILGVVITYRKRIENFKILANCIKNENINHLVNFYLISLGDKDPQVKDLCLESQITYHYVEYNMIFNIGLAYNIGSRVCKEKYIMKLDVDCVFYQGFFSKLLQEFYLLKKPDFLLISVFYAPKEFSETKLNTPPFSKAIFEDLRRLYIELGKRPTGTMFVMQRNHYIDIGGHDETFEGHGYEDFWLIFKLLNCKFPTLRFNNPSLAKCRIISAILNKKTNKKDLILIHRFHERNFNEEYLNKSKCNEDILLTNIKNLYK